MNGIVSFHPDDLKEKAAYNVPLAISRCEKYSDEVEKMVNVTAEVLTDNQIVIRPNERLATLYVSLQNYSNSLQTKYLYRIKGLHDDFMVANKNEITLNGLPYGKYTLKVKAKAPDGRFSTQILSIPLIVKRPFYFQWWFILLGIISLALAIWQLFQARTRVLQSRKKELEIIVKDRTAQLQEQATQLQLDKNTIEEQATELRSLDEMKSRFFANISHELRTPLTLILSPVQSILKRKKADNRDFTSAKIIEQNAQNLLKRINEILDLTKLEAKEMQIKPQPTPFYDFIKRLVANFEGFATEKEQNLSLDFQLDKNLTISLDQDKFEHIFNNYLSNAIKFTPKGGKINIQLTEQQEKNINGQLENQIILMVKDNGQGIIEEDLSKVFDRFFQSKNNKNRTSSSGIGLALSKEIANLMQGKVWVKSEFGKGSAFYFKMPFTEELSLIPRFRDKLENEKWRIENGELKMEN
ncbi:MAG: ATP-binding protein [Saprospiraceae bacterium]